MRIISLADLDGTDGFRIEGAATGDRIATSLSAAGDVNGDGIADIVIGSRYADPGGANRPGSAWVLFGKAGSFGPVFDLAGIDADDGFRFDGAAATDQLGRSVSGGGDFNGDGFADVLIGAPYADVTGRSNVGSAHLIFGKAGGEFPSGPDRLSGANGFRLDGVGTRDYTGIAVAFAGDVNGDGFDDIIIGAHFADPLGRDIAGVSYVVFGRAGGFDPVFVLDQLDGANGFRIDGVTEGDRSGAVVSSAGDVNGDGFDDLIVAAYQAAPSGRIAAGSSFVVFGKAGGFDPTLDLAALNGANGFRINGAAAVDRSGLSVSSAGDLNGDGVDDLIIGAPGSDTTDDDNGSAYVVFGRRTGFDAVLDLGGLTGTNGFRIDGFGEDHYAGFSVASAGDVNGDGLADIVIGAPGLGDAGAAFVVYGKQGGFDPVIDLATLDEREGFRIDGIGAGDQTGFAVSAAGDLNGDGIDDLLVSAPTFDPEGAPDAGAVFVVFGFRVVTDEADRLTGSGIGDRIEGRGGNDTILGGAGDDTLLGQRGDDVLRGGPGNDVLRGGPGNDILAGNAGRDRLAGGGGDDTMRGGGGDDTMRGGAGDDMLFGGGGSDRIIGGGGADTIIGGRGNDTIIGGPGPDVFVFRPGHGDDEIRRFQQGQDRIEFRGPVNSLNDLDISQQGANVLIEYRNGSILVTNQNAGDFGAEDFLF